MRKLAFTIVVLFFTVSICIGAATNWNIERRPTEKWLSGSVDDPAWNWMKEIDELVAAGGAGAGGAAGGGAAAALGTGNLYYVDSDVANEGDGSSWTNARNTLDEAIALCSSFNGDIIYVASGHNEALSGTDGVDVDVNGVTIIGIGSGDARPRFDYDASGGEFVIGASAVTISNLTFLPSATGITHAIDIEAPGDYAIIYNCEFLLGESLNTDEFTDTIQVSSTATDVKIIGNKMTHTSTSSQCNNFVDLSAATIARPSVIGNFVYGDFEEAPIWGGAAVPTQCIIANNTLTNLQTGDLAIEFTGNATGWCVGNIVSTDAIGTSIDAGRMGLYQNVWADLDTYDKTAVRYVGDHTGVTALLSASELAQIQAEATSAIEADHLDHLAAVSVADEIVDQSFLADITSATQDWSTFNASTDSLEAISVTLNAMSGVGFRGDATTNSTTNLVVSADLSGFGNDFFNAGWYITCTYDAGGSSAAPEGEVRDITNYDDSNDTFSVKPAFSSAVTANDKVYVRRYEEINTDTPTILGGSGEVIYVDSGAPGTTATGEAGLTWNNAYTTIALAIADANASNGDVIYVAAGHSEDIGAASIALNVAGISIIGIGEGSLQPTLNFNNGASMVVVSVADVYIENIKFSASTNTVAKGLDADGSADGLHLKNCDFVTASATDEFAIAIELMTATDDVTIEGCTFLAQGGSANEAIKCVTGALDNLQVIDNWFFGDWAVSAIWSDQIITNCLIKDNVINNITTGQHAIEFTGAATGNIVDNRLYGDTITAILDPGSMNCMGNMAVTAIDEQAIAIPLSAVTSGVSEEDDGSELERLEWLQNKVSDILATMKAAGGSLGDVFYVDDGGSDADGLTWATAKTTLAGGYALASAGDIVFVGPSHTESIASSTALATGGVTVIGIGTGGVGKANVRPRFTFTATGSALTVSGADNVFDGLRLYSSTAATTTAFAISDGGDRCVIQNCEFTDDASNEFDSAITLADDADGVIIKDNVFITGTDSEDCIQSTDGTVDELYITGNYIRGSYTNAAIWSDDVDTQVHIADNIISNIKTGIHAIEFSTTATGTIIRNMLYADTKGSVLDPGSLDCFENYAVNGVGTSAYLVPEVPSEGVTSGIGNVWYCDDGGDNGTGRSWETAKTTLQAAENLCSTGDTIYVGQAHNETMSAAGDATFDVAGVTVIGMGEGELRPLFILSETASVITLDANSVTLKNLQFQPGITVCSVGVRVEDAGRGCTIEDCSFIDGDAATVDEFVDAISVDAGADNLTVRNCTYYNSGTDGHTNTFVNLDEVTIDNCTIEGCTVYGDFAEACIWGSTAVPTNLNIKDNVLTNLQTGDLCIEFQGAATGVITGNRMRADTRGSVLDPGSTFCTDNYAVNAIDGVSYPVPLMPEEGLTYGMGNIWYCDDGGSNGDGRSWDTAKTTLLAAVALCSTGDTIYVGQHHNENWTNTTDVVIHDLNGISIIGMGYGENRPLFDYDSDTTCVFEVNSADVYLKNLQFRPGATDIAVGIRAEEDVRGLLIEDCAFVDGEAAGTDEFVDAISVESRATYVTVKNCTYFSTGNGCGTVVNLDEATIANATVEGCNFSGGFAEAAIWGAAAVPTNLIIKDNVISNTTSGQFCIEFQGAATGVCVDNRLYCDAYTTMLDPGSLKCIGNLGTDAIDQQSIAIPLSAETTDITAVADGSNLERLEFLQGAIGSYFITQPDVNLQVLTNNTQDATVDIGTASGELLLVDVLLSTDALNDASASAWAVFEISSNAGFGDTGADEPIITEAKASFTANETIGISEFDTEILPYLIEDGKVLYVHGSSAAGDKDMVVRIHLTFQRVTQGATMTTTDVGTIP
jgi:hypothetical protein